MAGFISADIKSLFKNKQISNSNSEQDKSTSKNSETTKQKQNDTTAKHKITDKNNLKYWGEELKIRLADNRKYSSQAQRSEYDIESEFFKEFYSYMWPDCAKQLYAIGDLLRKAFKVFGFDPHINPIYHFVKSVWVRKNLIKTGRLNSNTFKAIYTAVTENLVADSEFGKANNYNIIYCPDLYTKSDKEMLEYLELQKNILKISENKYKYNVLEKNKKALLFISGEQNISKLIDELRHINYESLPSVQNAKLNNIKLAKELSNKFSGIEELQTTRMSDDELDKDIISKLNNIAEGHSLLHALYIKTGNKNAFNALNQAPFNSVSLDKSLIADSKIIKLLPNIPLNKESSNNLVNKVISRFTNK